MKTCAYCKKETEIIEQGHCHTCYSRLKHQGVIKLIVFPEMPKILTPYQLEVLDGTVLGDATLSAFRKRNKAVLSITRSQIDISYLQWQYNVFKDFCLSGIRTKSYLYKKNGATYHNCAFQTRSAEALYPSYIRWYPNNKKVVPNDLKLTSVVMANWFYDDGCIYHHKKCPHLLEMSFATNSFTYDEVYFLKRLLEDRYNEKFCIYETKSVIGKNKGKSQFTIRAGNSASRAVAKDINLSNVLGMERKSSKWNNRLTHLYDNFHEKSRTMESKLTELKIVDFLLKNYNENDEVIINDLPDEIDIKRSVILKNFNRMIKEGAIIKCNDHNDDNYHRGTYYEIDKSLLLAYRKNHF